MEAGFYGDACIELLDGWVVDKMSHGPLAATVITILSDLFFRALNDGVSIRVQRPLHLRHSAPEPDIAIVAGRPMQFLQQNPTAAVTLAVMEVSDATLAKDRGVKLGVYARSAIPAYWLVNCVDHQLEIYSDPAPKKREPGYLRKITLHAGDVAVLQLPGQPRVQIPVAALFGAE